MACGPHRLTPRDTISLGRFRQLTMEVRRIVETPEDTASNGKEIHWLPFLIPPHEEEPTVLAESGTFSPDSGPQYASAELRRLLDETSDLLESPMASTVLAHMLAVGFEMLIDGKLAPLAFVPSGTIVQTAGPGSTTATGDESDASVLRNNGKIAKVIVEDSSTAKFASVLAVLARQAHVVGSESQKNEYLAVSKAPVRAGSCSVLIVIETRQWRKAQN